jgi:hypothetical protein
MKCPILRAGLIVGAIGLSLAGCQQTPKTDSASKMSKPDDPTAWPTHDISRGDPDPTTSRSGLPTSSGLSGGLSSESRDIEKSLGYSR